MSAESLTALARRRTEALMNSMVTIDRPGPVDRITGKPILTEVYYGKAWVTTYEAQETEALAAGWVFTTQRYVVKVPVAKAPEDYLPELGDIVTVTAHGNDPGLVGREYRVKALLHKGYASAYRLGVDDGPG